MFTFPWYALLCNKVHHFNTKFGASLKFINFSINKVDGEKNQIKHLVWFIESVYDP